MTNLNHTINTFFCKHFYSAFLVAALGLFVAAPSSFADTDSGYDAPHQVEEVISFVNINSADAATLSLLSGIGETKALAIIEYRETIGQFESIEQLTEVKGIGGRTIDKNRNVIVL
ncbi:MAG: ComEA family DNA-binding protein [Agarilytica sp.]